MLEEHLEWANASYYHSSEGTVNSNDYGDRRGRFNVSIPCQPLTAYLIPIKLIWCLY